MEQSIICPKHAIHNCSLNQRPIDIINSKLMRWKTISVTI